MLKVLSLLFLFASTFLAFDTFERELIAAADRHLAKYAGWLSRESALMLKEILVARARRTLIATIAGAFLFGLLAGTGFFGRIVTGLVCAVAGYFLPWLVVLFMRKRRLTAIDGQLVDSLQLMASALRAGRNFQQALDLVAEEMSPPISEEVGRLLKDYYWGRLTDDALRRFADRLPLEDIRLVVEAILTLRETGGNLGETFQIISNTIVERKKTQGQIEATTASGMMQGLIIGAMPLFLIVMLSLINPPYMKPFFTTPLGLFMLVVVASLSVSGYWLMHTLRKVDV